jgi:hypothetical protein
MKCRIQWIDEAGKPTPDDNEAVATVYRESYTELIYGRKVPFEASEHFPICQNHLDRFHKDRLDSKHWKLIPLNCEAE